MTRSCAIRGGSVFSADDSVCSVLVIQLWNSSLDVSLREGPKFCEWLAEEVET